MRDSLLNYEVIGGEKAGKPKMLMLHPWQLSSAYFRPLAMQPGIQDNFEVTAVDLIGHGGSNDAIGHYSVEDNVDAVQHTAEQLGLLDAKSGLTVVGSSYGGMVAAAFAKVESNNELSCISQLVLFGPLLQREDETDEAFVRGATRSGWALTRPGAEAKHRLVYERLRIAQLTARWVMGLDRETAHSVGELSFEALSETLEGLVNYGSQARKDIEGVLDAGVQVIAATGGKDKWQDDERRQYLDELAVRSNMRTKLVPGAGHHIPHRNPRLAAELICH